MITELPNIDAVNKTTYAADIRPGVNWISVVPAGAVSFPVNNKVEKYQWYSMKYDYKNRDKRSGKRHNICKFVFGIYMYNRVPFQHRHLVTSNTALTKVYFRTYIIFNIACKMEVGEH